MSIKSYNDVYTVYAWQDNNRTFTVTTSEGGLKHIRLILRDKQGTIDLTGDNVCIYYAATKPNGQEVLIEASKIDPVGGEIEFVLESSLTTNVGNVNGEIRIVAPLGVLKFYGINLNVLKGASDKAAEQSEAFTALVSALRKVSAVLADGTVAKLDDITEFDLGTNGRLNPMTSGELYKLFARYVPSTRTIAGVDLKDDITASELISKLEAYPLLITTALPTPSTQKVYNRQLCAVKKDGTNNEFKLYICFGQSGDNYRWGYVGGGTSSGTDISVEDIQNAVNKYFEENGVPKGEDGKSAYQIALDNGFEGTESEWLDSLNGKDGNSGVYIGAEEPTDEDIDVWINDNSSDLILPYINPISKTEDMTQPVGVDESGQLWVAPIGGGSGGDDNTGGEANTHGIIYDLINVNSSSSVVSVADGMPFVTVLTADEGYTLGDVTVTMGGEVLTGVWNAETSTLTIVSVTGDVIISCYASQGVDTSPVIAQYDKGYSGSKTIKNFTGVCITKVYPYTPDIDRIKASSYYDAVNDYVTSNGVCGEITVHTPLVKFKEAGYSDSGITANASKIVQYLDEEIVAAYSNVSLTSGNDTQTILSGRQQTSVMYANGISFTLSTLDVDDSYAYWVSEKHTILPIGVRSGDIIFAGKNTPYYGMANIDGTMAGGGASTANELSYDDDVAMNYGIATTSILGEEIATDTQTTYGLSKTFASVIDTARKEWITEYGGDYRKIPIIVSTDQHGRTNSGIFNMLGKVLNMHDVSKVMNLGDTTSTWYDADPTKPLLTDNTLDSWLESIKAIPYSKRLDVFGNHDTWYGNYQDEGNTIGTRYPSSQAHLYQYFRNIYARRTNNNGWFVDYDNQFNVKYVVISAFEYQGTVTFRIGTEQMNFIIEELSKNDGYDVVIVSHVPLYENPELNVYPTGQTSTTTARISELNTDDLFTARKTKGSGTITDSDGVEHNYDFTNCDGSLLCSLHGHTHYDAYLHLNDSLLVNSFDWFDDNTFFFVLIDRVNNQLNVWKVEAPNSVPTYTNYQIPFDKVTE